MSRRDWLEISGALRRRANDEHRIAERQRIQAIIERIGVGGSTAAERGVLGAKASGGFQEFCRVADSLGVPVPATAARFFQERMNEILPLDSEA